MNSNDKKIDTIKMLWATLTPKNQKVLKTLMKNQFNIDLNNFDMSIDHPNPKNEDFRLKMNLKYVKSSIIESLYQEIDMLSCCLYINEV